MRPDFGGKIAYSVYNNIDAAVDAVETTVREMFNSQLPLLTLEKIDSSFDETTGTISADLTYKLPNDQIIVTTTIGLIYIDGNNQAIKENL